MHIPVLFDEVLHYLDPHPGDFIIDGTAGGGGHAQEIIKRISPGGIFLGVDLDKTMVMKTEKRLMTNDKQLTTRFRHGNYADLPRILEREGLGLADGLLLDLGFSTEQLEGRGFSFRRDEILDMRYDFSNDARMKSNESQMAAEIVNSLTKNELADIFETCGEERYSRRIAGEIVVTRKRKRITRTVELAEVVRRAVPARYEGGRIHPATRVFQALRIYVNRELLNLDAVLKELPNVVLPQGRVVIISFHSLEDRRVKRTFREMGKQGNARILTKKPVRAGKEEVSENPSSRSAKLRAIQFN